MKAIAISGSARTGGNTEALLTHCLKRIAQETIDTELLRISDYRVAPCTACTECFNNKDGACVQNDDFMRIFDKMVAADIIIVGSPVYFGSATANLVALLDRAGYVARANGNLFSRKIGGPISVARRAGANFTYAQLMYFFMISDMVMPGSTYWNVGFGLEPGQVNNDEEALRTVDRFGENLAWLAQKTR